MANPNAPLAVLVVDDQPDAADSLAAVLALHGHAVRVAYAGPDALRLAAADPPDAVVLDITMPGMDGWEVARRLADLPRVPAIIAVTGRDGSRDRNQSAWSGIAFHFVKPVEPDTVLLALRAVALTRTPPRGG